MCIKYLYSLNIEIFQNIGFNSAIVWCLYLMACMSELGKATKDLVQLFPTPSDKLVSKYLQKVTIFKHVSLV
jgi:hypothetical protein